MWTISDQERRWAKSERKKKRNIRKKENDFTR